MKSDVQPTASLLLRSAFLLCGLLPTIDPVRAEEAQQYLAAAGGYSQYGAIPLPRSHSLAVPFASFGTGEMIRGSIAPNQKDVTAGTITLNLAGVPVAQAAKSILGDIMGVNYVVDPRVSGIMNVQTLHPITKAEALDLFQGALAPNGATVIQVGGTFRVVPVDMAATGSISTGRAPVSSLDGTSYRVVPLKYVAASEVARVLEPMVPKGMIVEADDARNIIALRGSAMTLRNVLDTIAGFDVDIMRGMSFGIVPVRSKQPERLVDDLRAVFAADREGPLKGRIRFIANARLGAVLVVTSLPSYLDLARDWIARLDAQREGSEPDLHIYSVQNRPARELAKVLQAMFGETGGDSGGLAGTLLSPKGGAQTVASMGGSGAGNAAWGGGAGGGMGAANAAFGDSGMGRPAGSMNAVANGPSANGGFGQPGGGEQAGSTALGGGGMGSVASANGSAAPFTALDQPHLKIVADDVKNTLLIMADKSDYRRILKVVRSMDVVASQVMIQAAVAEVTLNDQLQYGVQWQLQKNYNGSRTSFSDAAVGGISKILPGFNYAVNVSSIASTLSALNAITHVNVISTPSLMVLDSKTAALQIGDQVPVTTQTATSTVTTNGAIVNSVEMKDTGVILSVTPRINESGKIQLDIEQEVSAVVKTTSSNIDSPTIQQRRVKTTVVVKDGEVLALGGMMQNKLEKDSSEIPLLGQLPGVGALFASRNHAVSKTELIILIAPHVVRDTAEARTVTEDYRRQIRVSEPPAPGESSAANTVSRLVEHP